MANALAHHGRAFVKPVRYDGTDAVFPDFVLTDVAPHAYVEVYVKKSAAARPTNSARALNRPTTSARGPNSSNGMSLSRWSIFPFTTGSDAQFSPSWPGRMYTALGANGTAISAKHLILVA